MSESGRPDYQRIDELEQECVIIGRYGDMWMAVQERLAEMEAARTARRQEAVRSSSTS